jgi:hypothetical protein
MKKIGGGIHSQQIDPISLLSFIFQNKGSRLNSSNILDVVTGP